MKKLTQEQIITRVVNQAQGSLVPSWDIQKVETPWGWLGTSADRIARKMVEQGKLLKFREGKYVYYSSPVPAEQLGLF